MTIFLLLLWNKNTENNTITIKAATTENFIEEFKQIYIIIYHYDHHTGHNISNDSL